MIGLIFATLSEAKPFLEWSRSIRIDDTPFAVYQAPSKSHLFVTISGMGKVAAAIACQFQIKELKVKEIVNAGACGALQSGANFAPGELFCIASAVEGDHSISDDDPRPIISDGKIDWDLPAARLITCDRPVFDDEKRALLSSGGDLVDMEGAAIARVAALFGVPWSMIKGITDSAGPEDRDVLKGNLTMVSEKICRVLWNHLREIEE